MKSELLDANIKFLFFTMMQAALKMKRLGKDQIYFLNFAQGIWETLELNSDEDLDKILQTAIIKDIEELAK